MSDIKNVKSMVTVDMSTLNCYINSHIVGINNDILNKIAEAVSSKIKTNNSEIKYHLSFDGESWCPISNEFITLCGWKYIRVVINEEVIFTAEINKRE